MISQAHPYLRSSLRLRVVTAAATIGLCAATVAAPLAATAASGPRVVDSIPVAGVPGQLAVNSRNQVLNGHTLRVEARVSLPYNGEPGAVAVDPATARVYLADHWNDTVTGIDGHSDTVTKTIPVKGATGIAVDGGTGTILVSGADGVSVLDADTNTITSMVPISNHPGDVVVDSRSHQAYVAIRHGVKVIDGLPR